MTSKCTPGPWRCVTGGDGSYSILAGSMVLCQRNPWPNREVESHANGFLIEAAPALLAALLEWKCPSCGGKKTYIQRGASVSDAPKSMTGSGQMKPGVEVACKVCAGTGLHPTAHAAISQALGEG